MLQSYLTTKTKVLIAFGLVALACSLFWPVDLEKYNDVSKTLYDRNGELIHIERNCHDCWVLKAQDIDNQFKDLLLNFEDKWFYSHPGVNPFSIVRGLLQLIINKKIVSGGSTITMQVARLLTPGPRTFWKKLCEVHTALRLTTQYNKEDVLKMYLTLAPYGGNIHGIRAASLHYFGREPNFLPLSYKAMLVAIPQSPSKLRPDRFIEKANLAKNKVLQRMNGNSLCIKEAIAEICQIKITPFVKLAPHAFRLKKPIAIDKYYQESIKNLLESYVEKLPLPMNAACVVYNFKTDQVLVYIGSVGSNLRMDGNDMCKAIRSPGSLLKPFIYGLALERGLINPQSIITDKAINLKGYSPENFDMSFCGEMTIEEALQQSLNTPVIQVLNQIGPGYFFDWLAGKKVNLHFRSNNKRPGLAIGLGGLGMSLNELVQLFGMLAKGELLNKSTQEWITQTLAQTPMPDQRMNNPGIAYKTGTSYGFRDAWSVGYDNQCVVGLWVGRADGTPCPGYHGRQIAAPLMMQIFNILGITPIVCDQKLELTQKLRYKIPEKSDFAIVMPKKSSIICAPKGENIYLQSNSSDSVLWYVNGAYVGESTSAHAWIPEVEGFYQITAVNNKNLIDTCDLQVRYEP